MQQPLEPRSYFSTMGQNHDYDRRTYVYPDGSRHKPRVLPGDVDDVLAKKALTEEARVGAMCNAHGPGVLVVPAR